MTATTSGRPYRGVSFEERRAARRELLLDAGLEAFGFQGVAGTRVRDVCAAAGLTERYFYESFASPDDFFIAVIDHFTDEFGKQVRLAIANAPADPEERLHTVITAIVAATTDDPRLARLFLIEAFGAGEGLASRRTDFMLRAAELIRTIVFPGAKSSKSRSNDSFVTSLALAGATAELLVTWVGGQLRLSREALIDHLVRFFTTIAAESTTS